jgi:protein TonB
VTPLTYGDLIAWAVQAAIVASAALLALRVIRIDPPLVRYRTLRLVAVACLLLPFVQPRVPIGGAGTATAAAAFAPSATSDGAAAPGAASAGVSSAVAAGVLAGGATLRLVYIALGFVRLRRLRAAGMPMEWPDEVRDLPAAIAPHAAVRAVRNLGQPVTFGWRDPVVLLPEGLLKAPSAVQRAVVAHELWHVRRRDWPWSVAEELARACVWFHPPLRMLLSAIQSAREEVVDELAVQVTGSRRSYVDALVAYAGEPPLHAATAFIRRAHLVTRVRRLTKEVRMSASRVMAHTAAAVLATAAAGWAGATCFPLRAQEPALAFKPGPLEMRALAPTPENPVPRRVYHVTADYPSAAEAVALQGLVTVRVVLDEAGQVAESRIAGWRVKRGADGAVRTARHVDLEMALNAHVELTPGRGREPVRSLLEPVLAAALRAVRQWQYAPPAQGPLAFDVDVPFGPAVAPNSLPAAAGHAPLTGDDVPSTPGARLRTSDGAVRVGGNIAPPTKIRHVNPAYPPDAKAEGVQGVVIIEARIEADGTVGEARVLRSIPMLDAAALDAVRQWEFAPTLIDGEPVPVIMTVTINFTLQ